MASDGSNRKPVGLVPITQDAALKNKVYESLRQAITAMDIYAVKEPPKMDERKLADSLGVSRTPVREALSRLEQEGLVTNIPRKGTFVVRKTRKEIIEIIEVWAAIESMAARLATLHSNDQQLQDFAAASENYSSGQDKGPLHIDEYSENNIRFHQAIIELSGNQYLIETARRSFIHMHAIRASTIRDPERTLQSVIDHGRIIEALINRETELVERLVREHALKLADHVKKHVDFLD